MRRTGAVDALVVHDQARARQDHTVHHHRAAAIPRAVMVAAAVTGLPMMPARIRRRQRTVLRPCVRSVLRTVINNKTGNHVVKAHRGMHRIGRKDATMPDGAVGVTMVVAVNSDRWNSMHPARCRNTLRRERVY